jgi:NhaP-type Na+/H+ or K+/H+ antiporter
MGERLTELLKLAALMTFGALISGERLGQIGVRGWAFAAAGILVARPLALLVAVVRSRLDRRERLTAAWFGPKGFSSVLFSLLILNSGVRGANYLFDLAAATIAASMVLHSSTDVLVARRFGASDGAAAGADER